MSQRRRLRSSFIVVTCLIAAGLGVSAAYAVGAPAIQETPAGGAWGKSFDDDAALVQAERASRGEAPLLSLDWQNDFAIAVTQIQEEFPDHYADSGIVGTEGRAWVSFMAAAPPRAKSLLNALPVKVEIREGMGWTERDLVALGQSIHYSILDDREVASEVATDIDTATGSVTVSVKPVDGLTLAQADAALASEFPTVAAAVIQRELLATENVNARAALVATSQAASLRIEAVYSLDSGLDTVSGGGVLTTCTAGFTVRTSAYPHGIITAGHCSNSQKYFDRSVLTFRAEHRGGKGDVQWHSSTEKTDARFYYTHGATRALTGTANPTTGVTLCKYGKTTGNTCDEVYKLNQCRDNDCGLAMTHRRKANSGDSGGPWFYNNTGYGIHHGYKTYLLIQRDLFSPVRAAASVMGVTVKVS